MDRIPFEIEFSGSNKHDVTPFGDFIVLKPDAAGRKLTGLVGQGIECAEYEFVVSGVYPVTVSHDDSNSSSGNRFYMFDQVDRVLPPGVPWYATYYVQGLTTTSGSLGAGWYGAESLF